MIVTIKRQVFKVDHHSGTRTRCEIERHCGLLLDLTRCRYADMHDTIDQYQLDWAGLDVEYSLVLPPLLTSDIVKLKPQYAALRSHLGTRLVLRENLNSVVSLDMQQLSFRQAASCSCQKAVMGGRDLSTIDSVGYDIVQDNERLVRWLMSNPNGYIFGGLLRHIVNPKTHIEFGDIDVI